MGCTIDAMKQARSLLRWHHFGDCRSDAAPLPTPAYVDKLLSEAIAREEVQLALDAPAPPEQDIVSALAEIRDLFPIPEPGSKHENAWAEAVADPASVPAYVREMIAPQAPAQQTQPDLQRMWNEAMYANRQSPTDAAMDFGFAVLAASKAPEQKPLRECFYESPTMKVCNKCGQIHDKAIMSQEYPPECKTEDEKRAYAFGWWKALESTSKAPEPQKLEPLKGGWGCES